MKIPCQNNLVELALTFMKSLWQTSVLVFSRPIEYMVLIFRIYIPSDCQMKIHHRRSNSCEIGFSVFHWCILSILSSVSHIRKGLSRNNNKITLDTDKHFFERLCYTYCCISPWLFVVDYQIKLHCSSVMKRFLCCS